MPNNKANDQQIPANSINWLAIFKANQVKVKTVQE